MTALVTVGTIVKPHGLGGEVVIAPMTDIADRFAVGTSLTVGGSPMVVAASRPHQGRVLVRFEHVGDRNGAEALRGSTVEAPPLDIDGWDTYFVHELVGAVVEHDGNELGRVTAVIELPAAAAYDLLEVQRSDGTVWMLPAVDDYVDALDGPDGQVRLIVVDPPAGLLDDVVDAPPRPASP